MVVHRAEKSEEEIEVELQKKSGKGAGLCLTGYKSGKGAYVSDLVRIIRKSLYVNFIYYLGVLQVDWFHFKFSG